MDGACEEGMRGMLDIESLGTERSGIGRGWREEGWSGGGVRNCTRERLEGREVDLMIGMGWGVARCAGGCLHWGWGVLRVVLGVRKDGVLASRHENEMTAPSEPAAGAEPEEPAGTDNREDNMERGASMGSPR